MAQRDSARQEESIGTILVLMEGLKPLITRFCPLFGGGGSVVPSVPLKVGPGAWGLAGCFLHPHTGRAKT
mgnify:CR=1 FL=1